VDRFDQPVELELPLSFAHQASAMRAWLVPANGAPRQLLAQFDSSGKKGRARLAFLLDGPLLKGSQAVVHVYMAAEGLSTKRLDDTARTAEGPKAMKWLENDKLRLLLGPEGAHIYRWEVKALGNRDLAMPGETSWSGFADCGGQHRSARNELKWLARGPALVRYVCTDEHGLAKTISLWGGASWAEVTLNSPLRYFWAFDNPDNFAADGPTPGQYLFSTGAKGAIGKKADGVAAQVKARGAYWGVKLIPGKLALGMITPDVKALHVIAPGAGAGGVGIEGRVTASHFVIYGGQLEGEPGDLMNRLQRTLDFRDPPEVTLHRMQAR